MPKYSRTLMKWLPVVVPALFLIPVNLFAWTNGELLIWIDADRGYALEAVAKKFENDFGLKVLIEAPVSSIFKNTACNLILDRRKEAYGCYYLPQ